MKMNKKEVKEFKVNVICLTDKNGNKYLANNYKLNHPEGKKSELEFVNVFEGKFNAETKKYEYTKMDLKKVKVNEQFDIEYNGGYNRDVEKKSLAVFIKLK